MLSLESVCAGYRDTPVLQEISIEFGPSSLVSVIGKNGCGKSTLVKTACGLIAPSSGSVILDGKRRSAFGSKQWARRVSLLSQQQAGASLTVETLVMHGRFPYQTFSRKPSEHDWMLVDQAIRRVGLQGKRSRNINSLSGGERQKAYLAMLLAQDTDYVFLDEPATYLDIGFQRDLISVMESMRDAGKSVVAVMHDIESALLHSDSLCLMDGGRIVADGTADKIERSGLIEELFSIRMERVSGRNGSAYLFY